VATSGSKTGLDIGAYQLSVISWADIGS